jgi:hypothetical protein
LPCYLSDGTCGDTPPGPRQTFFDKRRDCSAVRLFDG